MSDNDKIHLAVTRAINIAMATNEPGQRVDARLIARAAVAAVKANLN